MNKINKLISANRSLVLGVSLGASVMGMGIAGYNYYEAKTHEEVHQFISNTLATSSEFLTYIKKQQTNALGEKIKFETISKKINSFPEVKTAMGLADEGQSFENFKSMQQQTFVNTIQKISNDKNAYLLSKEWMALENAKKTNEERYDTVYSTVRQKEFREQLDAIVKNSKHGMDYSAGLKALNSNLSDSFESAYKFYNQMVTQVNQDLDQKNYNLDQSEQQFLSEHTQEIKEMQSNIQKAQLENSQELEQSKEEAYRQLRNARSELDYFEYNRLKSEVEDQIAQSTQELQSNIQEYQGETANYNNFVKDDLKQDKEQVQQLTASSDRGQWGFMEYYLLYSWLTNRNTSSYGASSVNHAQVARNFPKVSAYRSLYSADSYQEGFKHKREVKMKTLLAGKKLPSSINSFHKRSKMPDMDKVGSLSNKVKLNKVSANVPKLKMSSKIKERLERSKARISQKISAKREAKRAERRAAEARKSSSSRRSSSFSRSRSS